MEEDTTPGSMSCYQKLLQQCTRSNRGEMERNGELQELLEMYSRTMYDTCSVTSNSVTPGTVAHQASLSMGCPRKEYWGGLSFPTPGNQIRIS